MTTRTLAPRLALVGLLATGFVAPGCASSESANQRRTEAATDPTKPAVVRQEIPGVRDVIVVVRESQFSTQCGPAARAEATQCLRQLGFNVISDEAREQAARELRRQESDETSPQGRMQGGHELNVQGFVYVTIESVEVNETQQVGGVFRFNFQNSTAQVTVELAHGTTRANVWSDSAKGNQGGRDVNGAVKAAIAHLFMSSFPYRPASQV